MKNSPFHYDRALLIEDNDIDIFVTEKVLSSVNFAKNIEIMSVDVALIRLQNGKYLPEIILLSLHSRFKSGFDFLNELQLLPKEVRAIKVVLLSISPFHSDEERAWQYEQVVGYLQKPVSKSSLEFLINNHRVNDNERL